MEKIKLTYEEAYKELALIASEIENETISVDVLAVKVKRASDLITFCQAKLKSTESEVNKIIAQMENSTQ
ncbi:exodeoxyribonuclease VII small subunit [Flavobacterium sp. Root420]|uniref:exodeoxyribonuclease VII small subunit n=1 Tax=Flavobacterium sp. Root420 TaxID=1736533 RepID=UPI0006F62419|nr:exodeoxyribonuclease VII small subunit [Flavobacterium sp. Root420]KQX00770.1 exonuclease VII small subunit [Flavobacterium sp. Root420]